MRKAASPLLVAVVLAVVAVLAVGGSLNGPSRWSPDGLFYQARVYEMRGEDHSTALQHAFGGPLGADLRARDPERSGDPSWVAYNAKFYERRVLVPAAAAVLTPVAGDRALLDISLAGYVAAVLAVFALLLVRFRLPIAAAGAAATIALPALQFHSSFPLTDSWGLALEAAALACALLAIDRSRRWVIPWAALILLLSFTRDSIWIPVLGAAWLALTTRSKTSFWLLGTGVAASLPAMLAVKVPMRELLGQMLTPGFQPNPDASWSWIASEYPSAIVNLLQADGGFVRDGAWGSAAYFLIGMAALFLLARGDAGTTLLKAGAFAGVAYVLAIPVFSAFRLELVWVPFAAFGLALLAERVAMRFRVASLIRPPLPSPSSGLSRQPLSQALSSSER